MPVIEKKVSQYSALSTNIQLPERISQAVWQTVAYANLFDYPVTLEEIHRYLIGFNATIETVEQILHEELVPKKILETQDELFFLTGRKNLVKFRKKRNHYAKQLWQQALRYGRWIAHIPFVRMVAVTGALANNNVEEGADLDYLIITQPGYLWLCRAIILLLVKITAPFGVKVCPNYLITTNVLALEERDFFTAQETSRMVPLVGMDIYYEFRKVNNWSDTYLPNAISAPYPEFQSDPMFKPLQVVGEFLLKGWLGRLLNHWEMNRKIAKFSLQEAGHSEVRFSINHCKGHFDHHASHTTIAYNNKIENMPDKLK